MDFKFISFVGHFSP